MMGVKIAKKERNCAIDVVKFMAVFLVLNSHMDICYPKYQFLATGGALGDSLFFFVSGFALLFGSGSNFFDWYKRRIARIYPTVIAVALLGALCFSDSSSFVDVILAKEYWFVGCILVYYVLLYPLRKVRNVMQTGVILFVLTIIVTLLIFVFVYDCQISPVEMGGVRYSIFLVFMLLGAMMGYKAKSYSFQWYYVPLIFVFAGLYYACFYLFNQTKWSLITIIPLLFFTKYVYLCCTANIFSKIYANVISGNIVFICSQLCLESYLIQKYMFTDMLNFLFPFNSNCNDCSYYSILCGKNDCSCYSSDNRF
ncbi:acyltransferase [uncultured Bacteroides sp.]|uniref:acyltransferase family protein n=1 Tax=uncultured Bacteroides sp. TaxID=162156 RepID=UPI0026744D90|nr:acyltransferase [uncultured Bacteroides sp.]